MTTNIETISDRAHTLHTEIKGLCKDVQKTFIEIGERLHEIENDKLYLVHGHPDFKSYLGDPDITIGYTMGHMAKEVYRHWILRLEYPSSTVELLDAGVSKLYICRMLAGPENCDQWLHDAANLSRTDLEKKVKDAGGAVDTGRRGGRPLSSSQLPVWTEQRAYNGVHNIIDTSYPEFPPREKEELTRAIIDEFKETAYPNLGGMDKSFWKKLARMYRGWYEGWYHRAIRAEQELELVRQENTKQFEMILELQQELQGTDDYERAFSDMATGVLLE
jgi:hypothetical protein